MFGHGKKQIEIDRLKESEEALTRRVASLEEEKRILQTAVTGLRSELVDARTKISDSGKEIHDLNAELERSKASVDNLQAELSAQIAENAKFEEEARLINEKLDTIAAERSAFKTKISNLNRTIAELRERLGQPAQEQNVIDFDDDFDDYISPASKTLRRTYGEPFRPQSPPSATDREWLIDLPPF